MEKYIGTKIIHAKEMNLGDYNKYRGWQIPIDENPLREGYLVKYKDDYESWSPKEAFEESYKKCDNMSFGLAIESMKLGKKVARSGWNGKGMFLYYVPSSSYTAITDVAKEEFGDKVEYLEYIAMKTVDGRVVPWLASQTDMLAEDWMIVS